MSVCLVQEIVVQVPLLHVQRQGVHQDKMLHMLGDFMVVVAQVQLVHSAVTVMVAVGVAQVDIELVKL